MKAPGSFADLLPVKGILEIRYPKNHRYWDVSGKTIGLVEAKLPLKCTLLGPVGFEFVPSPKCGIRTGTFYWDRMALEIDVAASPGLFEEHAVAFWAILVEAFGLDALTRVGNRHSFLFPTDAAVTADALLADRKIWALSDSLAAFGEPDSRGAALRTVLKEHDRRLRLEIIPGEHSVRGKNRKGILLDIDFSTEEAKTAQCLDLAEFLRWNQRFLHDNLHRVLRAQA